MYNEAKMTEAIRWILNLYEPDDYEAYDEDEISEDGGLCLHEVVMALRDKAQTVYHYQIDSDFDTSFKYRSAELFDQRAIRIFEENESTTFDNETTASYNTELWLLEDMSFVIVRCVSLRHDDGVIYESEYRTVLKQLKKREDLFFTPEDFIGVLEEACIPIWESEATIYEL